MQRQRRRSQETIVQPWGRVLVLPEGRYITISLSSSAGTKAPAQVEDDNFRLSTRFLEPGLPWWSSGKESTFQCRGHGSIPGRGIEIPHAAGQLSPRATTIELVRLRERAHMPQTTEPMRPGARAPQLEREETRMPQLEKPARHNEDPRHAQARPGTVRMHASTK